MNHFTLGDFCRLFCCPPRPSRVVAKFAFLPPTPSYNLISKSSGASRQSNHHNQHSNNQASDDGIRVTAVDVDIKDDSCFPPVLSRRNDTKSSRQDLYETWELKLNSEIDWTLNERNRKKIEVFFTVTRARSRIACMFVPTDAIPTLQYTILFSHGNAVDLGQMAAFLTSLAQSFGINIFCYDYSGYGLSSGQPLESNLYADAEAVLQAIQERYHYSLDRIILYGQSIGTAPTVELATRHKVAGVVLHSALMSGLRVVCPGTTTRFCFDPFTNIDKVGRIQSPTLVIHGEADEIIGVEHGYELFHSLRNPVEPIWIEGAGHNDVESFPEYAERLAKFLRQDLPTYWSKERREQAQQQQQATSHSQTATATTGTTATKPGSVNSQNKHNHSPSSSQHQQKQAAAVEKTRLLSSADNATAITTNKVKNNGDVPQQQEARSSSSQGTKSGDSPTKSTTSTDAQKKASASLHNTPHTSQTSLSAKQRRQSPV